MFLDLCSSRKPGRHQLAGLCGFAKEFVLAELSVPPTCAEGFWAGSAGAGSPRGSRRFARITLLVAMRFHGFDMSSSLPDLCFC